MLVKVLSENVDDGKEDIAVECSSVGCFVFKYMSYILLTAVVILIVGACCFSYFFRRAYTFRKQCQRQRIYHDKQIECELGVSLDSENIFQSGQWLSQCDQNGSWHRPARQMITFNTEKNILTGHGIDDIGQFRLAGSLSLTFSTVNIIKKYIRVTGGTQEKFGHEVRIDLEWSRERNSFIGKWTVHTSKCNDEGPFELRKVPQSSANKTSE
ncbi:unnamed protein product [Adineta ricciae]|uniref:Uncharacterized protein n=1 Tax=Adineta ricciae TaxID=249248 RepID=A0A814D2P6_ADIRI|nr:unnamed protein product [Adineta ricciae]CAF1334466.1 unnamed protein product [Adineta ricciae]